jgi:hypothetical protein
MEPSRQRAWTMLERDEDWEALAARTLPGEPAADAVQKLKSWNLHLFVRNPPGQVLGSDVIFVEPPLEGRDDPMRALVQGETGGSV